MDSTNVVEIIKIADKVEIISEAVDLKEVKTIAMITTIHNNKDETLIEIVVLEVVVLVLATMVTFHLNFLLKYFKSVERNKQLLVD